jgi:hypothetical protein
MPVVQGAEDNKFTLLSSVIVNLSLKLWMPLIKSPVSSMRSHGI